MDVEIRLFCQTTISKAKSEHFPLSITSTRCRMRKKISADIDFCPLGGRVSKYNIDVLLQSRYWSTILNMIGYDVDREHSGGVLSLATYWREVQYSISTELLGKVLLWRISFISHSDLIDCLFKKKKKKKMISAALKAQPPPPPTVSMSRFANECLRVGTRHNKHEAIKRPWIVENNCLFIMTLSGVTA